MRPFHQAVGAVLATAMSLAALEVVGTEEYRPLEQITVAVGDGHGGDAWVGFYRSDEDDEKYREWSYLRELPQGTFTVIAPKEYGTFEFRLFRDSGYERVSTASVKTVPYEVVFEISPDEMVAGREVTATFGGAPSATDAWIGFYRTSDPDETYLAWSYLRDLPSNSFTATVPEGKGKYDFRMFVDSDYFLVGKSGGQPRAARAQKPQTYRPCQAIRYRFERSGGNDEWIGFYQRSKGDDEYLTWAYLRDIEGDYFHVSAPTELGVYDFRVFKDSGYNVQAKSQPVTVVQYRPHLELVRKSAEAGAQIGVRVSDYPECDDAWVGLYADGAEDTSYLAYSYIRDLEGDVYRLPAPREAGTYRFRVFLDSGYTRLAESKAVKVK